MQAKKKRLTLDMDPAFQRRLKATAALKGVSMRQYCLTAIDGELSKDEVDGEGSQSTAHSGLEELMVLREDTFDGPGNAVSPAGMWREIKYEAIKPHSKDQKRPYRGLVKRFRELRKEVFGDTVLPGNSADLIREAREIRSRHMEDW